MATRSKTAGMWGLDITEGRFRLVHVSSGHKGVKLTHAVRIPVDPGSDEQTVGDMLRRAVEGSSLESRQIALCLPAADGAIVPANDDRLGANGDDFASLDFTTGDNRGFVVRGRRSTAARLAKIAELASLEPVCIMPLQAALAVSGDFFNRQHGDGSRVAVFVGQTRVHILRGNDGVVLTCRSAPRPISSDGYGDDVADVATQFFAAMNATNTKSTWPSSCEIFADDVNASQLRELSNRLGVSCRAASPAMRSGVQCEKDLCSIFSSFAAAVGAAITAMGLPDIKVDLSSEVFETVPQRKEGSGRAGATLLMLAVLAVIGYVMSGRISQRMQLNRLEQRYEQVQPDLQRAEDIAQQWSRMRSWLSEQDDGTRVAQLKILDRMIGLFPDPALAYVSDMDLNVRSGEVQIAVKGRASASEVLHECITRLNESGYFQARMGPVSDVEQAQAYPKKYSIPMSYSKPENEQKP